MGRNLIVSFEICILLNAFCSAQLRLNDECTLNKSNEKGICQPLDGCPTVVEDIRQHSIYPTLCGFHEGSQIICCPNRKKSEEQPLKDRISNQSLYQFSISLKKNFMICIFYRMW